ncbi:MAG: glycosyltransferase, partial [Niameybacter sp.]
RMPAIYPCNFKMYKQKLKTFFSEHPEYKIVHGHVSELGYFLYKEAYKQHIPRIICHAHNSSMDLDLKAPVRWYWKHACRKYITDQFACSTTAANWMYGRKKAARSIQMNNAIDTEKFRFNPDTRETIRQQLHLENNFVIGHVGRFYKQKNHEFLIRIFSEVYKAEKRSRLLLVGTGELQEKIEAQIKDLGIQDQVIFLGNRDDVHDVLQAFDVLLFPSLFEGLPVVMVEAQASGVRCVVSDRITRETVITPLVEVLSLEDTPQNWARTVLQYKDGYKRVDTSRFIVDYNFDIKANATWLQNQYEVKSR